MPKDSWLKELICESPENWFIWTLVQYFHNLNSYFLCLTYLFFTCHGPTWIGEHFWGRRWCSNSCSLWRPWVKAPCAKAPGIKLPLTPHSNLRVKAYFWQVVLWDYFLCFACAVFLSFYLSPIQNSFTNANGLLLNCMSSPNVHHWKGLVISLLLPRWAWKLLHPSNLF